MKDNKVIIWSIIEGLEEIVPPQPAKKYIPEWWKNVPATAPEAGDGRSKKARETVKACPAVYDWFQQGYVIPMWADLHVELKENGKITIADSDNVFGATGFMKDDAYISWLPEEQKEQAVAVLRPACPWRIKTPSGYSSYQFPMWYHFNPDFEVPPGPAWTDEYHLINPQIIIKHYGEIKINRGTPLCVIVPYKREPDDTFHYEIKRRDEECKMLEQKTALIARTKFHGGYKEMQAAGGCPIHNK